MLSGAEIRKEIGGQQILQGVSIDVAPGTITALLGPNGSGKTSLLRALALIDPPGSGRVQIDERVYSFPATTKLPEIPPWPTVTVVFQQHFLWPHLTLKDNIELPAKLRRVVDWQSDAERIVSKLELGAVLNRFPNQVSGGQRQRAALARALLLKPSYLLMDEITASLDLEQTREVLSLLPELKQQGTGMLLTTHLIGFAKHVSDRVVFLDGGKIVEEGGPGILDAPATPRLQAFLSVA